MNTIIMALTIEPRNAHAVDVQDVLTKHGCIIKTRLGLHEADQNMCSQKGLIILQLHGDIEKVEELKKDLEIIEGVKVNYMVL
ncbi:hypothetical protein CLOACE_01270 [Clostridium acetireducens DSM 10703]|jgi:hypothetical protein|uniref:Iron-only hydrogenase system regulator n=1 Tax=Clostridium acetireducens DSM 10703 TaxID=1121290 RepID=A0A1E8F2E7_9CLOT|nr:hypothetical protein [Clostridium acetireducens]OFI07779.1 hypothetical protein CLOACE_01270 [Clostridium acetireducens DSM 10703]